MPIDLISEEELRLALKPCRVDPRDFEAGVRERVDEGAGRQVDPLDTMPPLLKSAAALLPVEILTQGQIIGTAAKSSPIAGILSKLLGYAAFPAISLFVLLGATVFSAFKIRRIQSQNTSGMALHPIDGQTFHASATQWWRDHRWGGMLLFAITLALPWFGATSLLLLVYIASISLLLYILKSFARVGIGNRTIVGGSCAFGLMLLGQLAGGVNMGEGDIHVMDQTLLVPLFLLGTGAVVLIATWGKSKMLSAVTAGLFAVLAVALVWFVSPTVHPATPAKIRAYVESFDHAEFSSASWREWEPVASWAVRSVPGVDLSRPRRLLEEEIVNQDPALPGILDSALKVGILQRDQVLQLQGYEQSLRKLLAASSSLQIPPNDDDWVIRAAVLRNDLTPEQRDQLAARLHENLRSSLQNPPATLFAPLRATQLLEVLGRPVDPAQYREKIHAQLTKLHSKTAGGFQRAGGFRAVDVESLRAGDLNATSDAVALMEIYGIPKDLDVNWVRSFLRPSVIAVPSQRWTAAVALERLDRLPGISRPSWFESLYYERNFLAGMILIGLCIYATAISPHAFKSPEVRS
jgi:hypothetical protein